MDTSKRLSARGARAIYFFVTVCIVMIADQATKLAVRSTLAVGERREFLPGLLDLLYVRNDGAAFSMGRGAGVVFVAIAAMVLVGAFALVWREELPTSLVVSVSCVAGGGVGNMIDRLSSGYVTDFFATTFVDFPVFNVADVFVTCGVVVSLVLYWRWDAARARAAEPVTKVEASRGERGEQGE